MGLIQLVNVSPFSVDSECNIYYFIGAVCPDLPVPANGVITYTPTTTPRAVDTRAVYTCTTGYQMTGLVVRMCTATGWSSTGPGDDPVCTGEGDVFIVLTVLIVRHHSHL